MFSDLGRQAMDYIHDAQQRSILYLDAMRQSGDQYVEHVSQGKPPVLVFDHELIADGRELPNPVNYALLRIVPPADMPTNLEARPFVIIDPRAGHGPGVAGSKIHSEVGVALAAGHPCYFVTFGPYPEADQSIYCVLRAEKYFLELVAQRHDPVKVGKPFVIGNCQGGWALMMLASVAPKTVGPIMLAGAPLAYWSGKSGQNPMRYSGGMLGGSWTSSLVSDLGNGIFDGAYLVDNFENLDPANTFWKKPYRLYANIDTEVERYLDFDRWWAGHFMMTRQEIDWIVQNLFIGNKLSKGELPNPLSGGNINLRNIRSPILVFASQADNITPPSQALNWISDIYVDDEDLRAHEQVIVYNVHESTGHLGIFVSSGVANREHEALVGVLDLLELLPPGLYEARIEDLHPDTPHQQWVKGRHVVTFEPRSIADLSALDDGREEESDFEVVNRVSKLNQHVYDLTLSPIVRSLSNPWLAQARRTLQPRRFTRYAWSSLNPLALSFKQEAEKIRQNRQPLLTENVFLEMEHLFSENISRSLDAWRDIRDQSIELLFRSIYGSPWLRTVVGLDQNNTNQHSTISSETALHEELHDLRLQLSKAQITEGGPTEAFARILVYMAGEQSFVDERAFNLLQNLVKERAQDYILPDLIRLKQELRKQWRIVHLYPTEAIEALPKLIPYENQRSMIWGAVEEIAQLKDILNVDEKMQQRFADIANVLGLSSPWQAPADVIATLQQRKEQDRANAQAKFIQEFQDQAEVDMAAALAEARFQAELLLAEQAKKLEQAQELAKQETKKAALAIAAAKKELEEAKETYSQLKQAEAKALTEPTPSKSIAKSSTTDDLASTPVAKKTAAASKASKNSAKKRTKAVAKKPSAAKKVAANQNSLALSEDEPKSIDS